MEYRHKGINPGWFKNWCTEVGTALWNSGSPSPHFFCQHGLSWEPSGFFSRGAGADLLPHVAVISPSRNRTDSLICLSAKMKDLISAPSRFVLYQGSSLSSLPMLWYFWIAPSLSGIIIRDKLIVFSPQGGAWAFQFITLRAFSSHWLIATLVTISGTKQHHYKYMEFIAISASWGYSGTWGESHTVHKPGEHNVFGAFLVKLQDNLFRWGHIFMELNSFIWPCMTFEPIITGKEWAELLQLVSSAQKYVI